MAIPTILSTTVLNDIVLIANNINNNILQRVIVNLKYSFVVLKFKTHVLNTCLYDILQQ